MKRSYRPFLYLSLVAFPAALMATTPVSSPQSDEKAALRQAIDQYMVTLFKPGEMDPNWNKEGADLAKALDAKPNHVLVEVDKDGRRSIMIYTGRSMTTFVPAEWELVTTVGRDDSNPSLNSPIEIGEIEDGYYSVSRSSDERVGDAYCSAAPDTAQLYRTKGAKEGGMTREMASFLFRELFERAKSITVCTRYDVTGIGFRAHHFLKDGRSLPAFDEASGITTIVPMQPTMELLKGD